METAGGGQERRDALPRGAALRDYTIEAVLGHGGFGIVYRARHNELGNVVAIKEYLPIELALREGASVHPRSAACRAGYEDGLRRFRDEARALIEFQSHPSIVSCRDFFRANGTAYLVMEHEDGMPLSELLRRREEAGRPFDEADMLAVMVPLLEGLRQVHEAGMLHRDIKPSNILVRREDERPVLIDFGAAKQMAAERSKSLAPFTEGYAALEQVGEGALGPWTDLYAVGAVMWRMVAGGNPPWEPPHPVKVEKRANAVVRATADPMPSARGLGAGRFSPGVLDAIDRCLKLNEKDRVRDCGELLGLLRGAGAVEKAPAAAPPRAVERRAAHTTAEAVGQKSVPQRRALPAGEQAGRWRRRWVLPAAGVALAAVLGAAWFGAASRGGEDRAREAEVLARAEAAWGLAKAGREAEELRAYIEEYGGVEGAGEWVGLAESLLEELDREEREAVPREEEALAREEERLRELARKKQEEARKEREAAEQRRAAKAKAERERLAREAEEKKHPGRRFRDCDACPEMVVIPAGSFLMGSPESEEGRADDEGPQHRVTIGEAFAAGVYEVTFEEWGACVADGGCGGYRPKDYGWGRGRRPVINVSWEDAQAYVRWLSRKTGKEYRLLSEAEWEYAARAGSRTQHSFGDEITSRDANYGGNIGKTRPVGGYRANGYGLHDMHGNVWEWVRDCWNGSYAGAPNNGEAWERGDCSRRVLRGGSWGSYSWNLRSANRLGIHSEFRLDSNGFRVARTLTP